MTKKTAEEQSASKKSSGVKKPVRKEVKSEPMTVDSVLPVGSQKRMAAGVAAAAGGALLVTATIGAGPAALVGAAGYLAYKGMSEKDKEDKTDIAPRKR
jgi:hypothetical protein